MNAKELHALVAGPFTMPDGTKRRALWERVPGARPCHPEHGPLLFNLQMSDESIPRWGGLYASARPLDLLLVTPLIRVAIEDWIDGVMYTRGQQPDNLDDSLEWGLHWLVKCKDGYSAGISVSEMYERDRITMETTAPDRMTCLVAFAHAVADALGVPH